MIDKMSTNESYTDSSPGAIVQWTQMNYYNHNYFILF
jgi:hypothetical protein